MRTKARLGETIIDVERQWSVLNNIQRLKMVEAVLAADGWRLGCAAGVDTRVSQVLILLPHHCLLRTVHWCQVDKVDERLRRSGLA